MMHDKLFNWLSRHLPDKLIYFCAIRLAVYATTGKYSDQIVPDLLLMDAIKRWEENT